MKIPWKADVQWSIWNTGISGKGQYYGGAFKYEVFCKFFLLQSETAWSNAEGAQCFTGRHNCRLSIELYGYYYTINNPS